MSSSPLSRPVKRAKTAKATTRMTSTTTASATTTTNACWDDLPSEALLLIGCLVDAVDLAKLALVNKATFYAFQQEIATRSILGIRLAYLNERGQQKSHAKDRFRRLQGIPDFDPKVMEYFFQHELLPPQLIVLQHMFAHNQNCSHDAPQFVIAGGSMLTFYRHYHKNANYQQQRRFRSWEIFGDLDVFVMESSTQGPEASDRAVESVLCQAGEEIERHASSGGSDYDYAVLRHSGTFTMVVNNKNRPLTIILRRISCIEELLMFFDLDCCRFAFDGTKFVSTIEGLRSVAICQNFVDEEHIENPMYCRRSIKYGYRGFNTGFGRIHPLQHLLPMDTNVFYNEESEHSEAVESSRQYAVDEGLYSSLGNASLDELHELAAWNSDEENSDEDEDEDAGDDYQDDRGELILRYRGDKSALKSLLVNDCGFAPNFAIHFDMMKSPMFLHYYYESHLRRKYNIARCYVTGQWFHCSDKGEVHFSPEGARINRVGYETTRDLKGMIALVTGARVKIGFATCLELLRSGATVVGTSRFAADAEARYRKEKDYDQFRDRLFVLPLNLLCVEDIQNVAQYIEKKFGKLHILINNAAQTVRLPLRCYTKLIQKEYKALSKAVLDSGAEASNTLDASGSAEKQEGATTSGLSKALTVAQNKLEIQVPESLGHLYAPPESLVTSFQSLDSLDKLDEVTSLRLSTLRSMFKNPHPDDLKDFRGSEIPKNPMKAGQNAINSWKLEPTDIHPIELFETQTINHLAPTMLLNALVPMMSNAKTQKSGDDVPPYSGPSYVINVTSIEGQFSVADGVKESHHLHTNMSKSAMNMLTRSGSSFYAKKGILVNSVDTGWVSSTIPTWKEPPLTTRDAALRILHPILSESPDSGKLYKNYRQVPW